MEFLLACLSVDGYGEYPAVGEIPLPVWQSTLAEAARHQVTLLLYHQLSSRKLIEGLPIEVSQEFSTVNRAEVLENLTIMGYTCQVIKDLYREGIPVLPLKGFSWPGISTPMWPAVV